MTTNLLDHLRSTFTTSAVTDLSRLLSESPSAVEKALDGLLPAIVTGVVHRSQTDEGAATLYRLLTTTSFDTDPSLVQLVETSNHRQKAAEAGNQLLRELHPDQPERLAEATAQYSGVGLGSASTLTGLVMSILMGYLHKQLKARNLTSAQLASLLASEGQTVRGLIPAALAGLIGWFIGGDTIRTATTTAIPASTVSATNREEETRAGFPWLRWLLILLGLLLLFWLLTRACNRNETNTSTGQTDTTTTSVGAASDTIASDLDGNENEAGPAVRVGVDLPNGRKLNVEENSFNYSLAKFLSTKGGQLPKVFTFDNLVFDTDSARITPSAQQNVNDLIEIMRAYPTLEVRIEGNTDSTGDDAINDPLSAARAEAVKTALVRAGIEAGRITTRERGDTKPVASNETAAGRQKNRRIDVIVTKV